MRGLLLTLGRQAMIYGFSGAAVQALGLITLPIYTRAFTPTDYGIIELAGAGLAAMIVAVDAGLGSGMQRDYFDVDEEDSDGRRAVTSTATLTSVGLAVLIAIPLIVFRVPIAGWAFEDDGLGDIVALVALAGVAGTLATFLRDIMRLRFQPGQFAISSFLGAGVGAAVGVVLVVWNDDGPVAVILGLFVGQAIAALYSLVIVRRHIGPRVSRTRLRSLLSFGLPLVPATAALWGITFADRLFLSRLDGLASTGEYAVGARFASILLFIVGAFGTAYTPFLYSMNSEAPEEEPTLRALLLKYAAAAFVGIALALALFAREIAVIVTPGFDRAYTIVGILCLGIAAFGLTAIVGAGMGIARQTHYVARYAIIVLGANVALCFLLIPIWGLVGAALATSISYALLAVLYLQRSQRLSRAPFDLRALAGTFLIGSALVPVGLVDLPADAETLALKVAAFGLYCAALVWPIRAIGQGERAEVRAMVSRFRLRNAGDP